MVGNFYGSLPISIQNFLLSLYGLKINHSRYGSHFDRAFLELDGNFFESEHELDLYHNRQFELLIGKIKQSKRSLQRFEFLYGSIYKIQNLDDLKALPITTKTMIKECLKIFPSHITEYNFKVCHTSGTTGSGMIFPVSNIALAYQWAVWWRYRQRLGLNRDQLCGYFGGRYIVPSHEKKCFYRYNKASKQLMFSAYHLNENTLNSYLEGLIKYQPTWLHGYPSFLAALANLMLKNGVDLPFRITNVTVGAESLLAEQKNSISKAFRCNVFEHYGLAEGVVNISQSAEGKLIVDEDYSICEFLDHKLGAKKIIGTNLHNYHLPFLRYDTGDLLDLTGQRNLLGREVKSIIGRVEDEITLKDGTKVGRLDHFFKDQCKIYEAQIIQNKVGEILVKIVSSNDFGSLDAKKLLDEFNGRFGNRLDVDLQRVNLIEKTKSGKSKFVINNT